MLIRRSFFIAAASLLAAAFGLLAMPGADASAGSVWIEDWTGQNLDKWYPHTFNPATDQFSFVPGEPDGMNLVMTGDSWGIETRQAFNRNAPISVESLVKVGPIGPNAAETQYFAGITIYAGESEYYEICLFDNVTSGGLRAYALENDIATLLPNSAAAFPATGGINGNLPRDQFYKLRLDYDGKGTFRYYVNDVLLLTRNNKPMSSNPDIFLLSVAQNSCTYYYPVPCAEHGTYLVETTFQEVMVRGRYNLFGHTTWVNFELGQENEKVNTKGEGCTFGQCDFLQLEQPCPEPSICYGGTGPLPTHGYTVSPVVTLTDEDLAEGLGWGEVLTTTALDGQKVTVEVIDATSPLPYPDNLVPEPYLPGNKEGFGSNAVNLSGLDPELFPSLKIKINLYTYDRFKTPKLLDWTLTFATSSYFTWYDQFTPGMKNWLLTSHPDSFGGEAHFWAQLGSPPDMKTAYKTAMHGKTAYTTWPGAMGGPVKVTKLSGLPALISQRILYGDSLEETLAFDENRLWDHYYWPWYDELSPGYKNWVLVANPGSQPVSAEISFIDNGTGALVSEIFDIPPGQEVTPNFPGFMGGPVEVRAWETSNPGIPARVMASQRVTSGDGLSFNEVSGIPARELSDHYYWTWYDNFSPGARNWVLVANPDPANVIEYQISIAGGCAAGISARCRTGTLDPAGGLTGANYATPTFPGVMGGPVEVRAWNKEGGMPARVIASQRVAWGESFEELPGFPGDRLDSRYHWTWYDDFSEGVANWVVIANLENENPVTAEVHIGGRHRGTFNLAEAGSAQAMAPVRFDGVMSGPVEVRAYDRGGSWSNPADRRQVLASQRVLWKGFFNEVEGTVLDLD
ncbi:MAG: hypothetical protein IBX61_04075 [Thermoleophilia bacterium]|nr:hypothetical protein [Thermoleophilia bacterium]